MLCGGCNKTQLSVSIVVIMSSIPALNLIYALLCVIKQAEGKCLMSSLDTVHVHLQECIPREVRECKRLSESAIRHIHELR